MTKISHAVLQQIKPWKIVLVGVALTVASAIISHYQLAKNMKNIEVLEKQIREIDQIISDTWQNMARFERDGNQALTLASLAEEGKTENMTLYIQRLIKKSDVKADKVRRLERLKSQNQKEKNVFAQILVLVDAQRAYITDKIDTLYIKKVGLQEQVQSLRESNTSSANLALVLQTLGLICVLSKDLARREWPK